jgi:hypothetical protein
MPEDTLSKNPSSKKNYNIDIVYLRQKKPKKFNDAEENSTFKVQKQKHISVMVYTYLFSNWD